MKLKTYAFLNGETLLNSNGRLSDCVCCCDVPPTLYLHVVPLYGDPDCEGFDQGTEIVFGSGEQFPENNPSGHCHDFSIGFVDGQTLDDFFRCNNGTPEPGSPQTLFGLSALFHCSPVNEFHLSLCMTVDVLIEPGWPFSGCQVQYDALIPTSQNTCDTLPGEFFAEFTEDLNADPLFPPTCICPFLFRVDENPNYVPPSANLYLYPAEAARGVPMSMPPMLHFFEANPSIGTPPNSAPSALLSMRRDRRVGMLIHEAMRLYGWREPQNLGCGRLITTKLNKWKVAGIRKHMDYWERELRGAMDAWYTRIEKKREPIPSEAKEHARELLEWACDEAEAAGGK